MTRQLFRASFSGVSCTQTIILTLMRFVTPSIVFTVVVVAALNFKTSWYFELTQLLLFTSLFFFQIATKLCDRSEPNDRAHLSPSTLNRNHNKISRMRITMAARRRIYPKYQTIFWVPQCVNISSWASPYRVSQSQSQSVVFAFDLKLNWRKNTRFFNYFAEWKWKFGTEVAAT